jgi:hypothetical protein
LAELNRQLGINQKLNITELKIGERGGIDLGIPLAESGRRGGFEPQAAIDAIAAQGKLIAGFGRNLFGRINAEIIKMRENLQNIGFSEAQLEINKFANDAQKQIRLLNGIIDQEPALIERVREAFQELRQEKFGPELAELTRISMELKFQPEALRDAVKAWEEKNETAVKGLRKLNEEQEKEIGLIRDSIDAVEKARDAAEQSITDKKKEVGALALATLGESVFVDVTRGLIDAFERGEDLGKNWAKIIGGALKQQLNKVITDLGIGLRTLLQNLFKDAAQGAAIAGIAGALIGVAGLILSNLESSRDATVEDFDSAVESTEAVRGVVAGPTNVAIGQVGEQLKFALVNTEILLERIATAVEGGGGIGGGESSGISNVGPGASLRLSGSTT